MANPIQPNATFTPPSSIRKGNVAVGINPAEYSQIGNFWSGIDCPAGGYVTYINKPTNGPSIYVSPSDADYVNLVTGDFKAPGVTGVASALTYVAGLSDRITVNMDYQNVVTNGLVLLVDAGYTPSYPTAGTTWYNLGGSPNGTLTNSPLFSTDAGGSIFFDGTDDFINFGNNLDLGTNPFTLEYFAKTTTNPNAYSKIMSKGHYLQGGWTSYFGRDPGTGLYSISLQYGNNSTGWMGIAGLENASLNVYYHVVYTKDSNNLLSSYINGVFAYSKTETYDFSSPSFNYVVGRAGSSQEWFKGNIGIVRQYNRALTASEVLQNFNAQKSRYGL